MTASHVPAPGLTQEQVDTFWKQGFITGIPILTPDQTRIARRKFEALEAEEQAKAGERWTDPDYTPWNQLNHPIQRWCRAMSTHPRVLAAVAAILGPDLLIRNADVFIKEPGTSRRINWHVDCTAPIETARLMVTAWFGLTASTLENGCVDFIPGSHRDPLPNSASDKHNLTFRGEALAAMDEQAHVANVMPLGHLSLHCFRTVHRSSGNHSADRRFGYITRFASAGVTEEAAECGVAFLASGKEDATNLSLRKDFPISWNVRTNVRDG